MVHPFRVLIAVLALVLLPAVRASANPQPAGLYDSRSLGMGGVGTATVDNAAAIFLNPAALEQIDKVSATMTFSPIVAGTISGPWGGPGTEEDSQSIFFPLGFVGAAYRVWDPLVIGIGAYLNTGAGGQYKNVTALGGNDMTAGGFAGDLSVPFSFRLIKGLSIAVGPRITYAQQTAEVVQFEPNSMMFLPVKQDLSGFSFLGLTAGVHYELDSSLRFGFQYVSKTSTKIEGDTETGGMKLETSTRFNTPHTFRLGASYRTLAERLIVSVDLKYQMYSESHEQSKTTTTVAGMKMEQVTDTDWRDAITGILGAEFWVLPEVPVRAGYQVGNSATSDKSASAFLPPPGLMHAVSVGSGYWWPSVHLDAGLMYAFSSAEVDSGPTAGKYGLNTLTASLSASYVY